MSPRMPRLLFAGLSLVATFIVATASIAADLDPNDWPYWRGPLGNSISPVTGLPETIDPAGGEGSNLLWKSEEAAGRSTPIILRGKLYTIVRDKPGSSEEGEKVICVDPESGKILWEKAWNVWSSDVPDTRVGWSSVVGDPATGKVYALGVSGYFSCIDGESGETVWSIPLHEQFGMLSTYGGRTNYPVVCDDLVILGAVFIGWGEMARPAFRLAGFDKETGEARWYTSTRPLPEDTTHSGPTLCVINGQKLLVTGSGDGWVYAFQPRTGRKVWEYQFSRRGINVSPTVVGETVYMGHSEENPTGTRMGAVAAINGALTGDISKTGELWNELEIGVGKSSILAVDGRLYCPDDSGKLHVLEADTGKLVGRKIGLGTMNYASPLFAEGRIYHMEKNGRWYILTPSEKEGVERFKRGETTGNFPIGEECWASPVVSNGKLFIQTTGALYCFQDKSKTPGVSKLPEMPAEADVASDSKPAHLQVVPAELLMKPGQKQQFTVRVFNSRGQLLDEKPQVAYSVEGDGKITDGGLYTPAEKSSHTAAYVKATAGDLTGRARVRIVPELPWKFDFTGLKDAPVTWVGARYRHVMRDIDGNTVMVKITTIPKGTRSRAWIGHSDMSDYTMQADMLATTVEGKLPDLGITAQGYKLGVEPKETSAEYARANKKLILNSWDSHDHRLATRKPFILQPNTWYTLKLKVSNDGDKALVQGKVWKRDEPEPKQWAIELVDTRPNKQGAPGFHCNATDAEIFIDNVIVAPNE
jgi:outer membrane protein assembly factor BamB